MSDNNDEQIVKLVYDASESLKNFNLLEKAIDGQSRAITELAKILREADTTGKANIATLVAQGAAGEKVKITMENLHSTTRKIIAVNVEAKDSAYQLTQAQTDLAIALNRTKEAAENSFWEEQEREVDALDAAIEKLRVDQLGLAAAMNRVREAAQTEYLLEQQEETLAAAQATENLKLEQLGLAAAINRTKEAAQSKYLQEQQEEILADAEATEALRLEQLELAAAINQVKDAAQSKYIQEQQEEILADAEATEKLRLEQEKLSAAMRKVREESDYRNQITGVSQGISQHFANQGQSPASPEEINEYNSAVSRFNEAVIRAGASAQEAQAIFQNVLNGVPAVYNKEQQAIADSASNIIKNGKQLGNAFDEVGKKGYDASQNILISWQSLARFFVTHVAYSAVYRLIGAMKEGIKTAADFELQIAEIRTLSDQNGLSVDQWADKIRALSDAFALPLKDVAKGTYEVLSNQIAKGAEATEFLGKAMEFARVTASTTEQSVDLLSSVINAYGKTTADTGDIAAKFFKIIDLGRVRAGEMANTFGRVASLTSTLGVSFEETGAAITTLTRQGVKYDEAFTLINGLMLKLLKPTDDMKKLFKEWGVASGEAAIKTFGFPETLRKLEAAANGSSGELAEMLSNVRAIRGALGLTGSAFDKYADDLDKIKNSTNQYNRATEEIKNNAGFQFEQEFNKLKNTLTVDLGKNVIDTLASWSTAMGGLTVVTGEVLAVTKILLETWLLMKGVPLVLGTISSGVDGIRLAWISARNAQAGFTAQQAASIAATKANLISLAVTVAVAAAVSVYEYQKHLQENIDQANKLAAEKYKEFYDKQNQEYKQQLNKRENVFKDSLKEQFQEINKHIASVQILYDKQADAIAESYVSIQDKVKAGLGGVLDDARDQISKIKTDMTETARGIEHAADNIRKFQKEYNSDQFKIQFDDSTPADQVKLIQTQIADRIAAGQKLESQLKKNPLVGTFKEDTEATSDAFNEAYKAAQDLAKKRHDIEKELAKKKLELAKTTTKQVTDNEILQAQQAVEAASHTHNSNAKAQAEEYLKQLRETRSSNTDAGHRKELEDEITSLEAQAKALGDLKSVQAQVLAIEQQREDAQKVISGLLDKRAAADQKAKDAAEDQFRLLKTSIEAFEKFKIKDTKGKLLFPTEQAALDQFDKLKAEVAKNIKGSGQLPVFGLIGQQEIEVKKQLDNAYNKEYLEAVEIRLNAENDLIVKKRGELAKRLGELGQKKSGDLTEIQQIAATANAFGVRGSSVINSLRQQHPLDSQRASADIISASSNLADLAERAGNGANLDPALVDKMLKNTELLKDAYARYAAAASTYFNKGNGGLPIKDGVTATSEYTRLKQLLDQLTTNNNEQSSVSKDLEAYDTKIKAIQASITQLGQLQSTTFQSLRENLPKTVDDILLDIDKMISKINELKNAATTGGLVPTSANFNGQVAGVRPTALSSNRTSQWSGDLILQVPALTGNTPVDIKAIATGLRQAIRRGDIPALA